MRDSQKIIRLEVRNIVVRSAKMRNSELWTITGKHEGRTKAVKMKILRRIKQKTIHEKYVSEDSSKESL